MEKFDKNRFTLELIDPLLVKPCIVPLVEPTVTVGMDGDYSLNIPLDAMGLGGFRELLKPHMGKPMITLSFDFQTNTWAGVADAVAVAAPNGSPSIPRRLVPDEIPISVILELDEAYYNEFHQDEEDFESVLIFGSFVVMLHDAKRRSSPQPKTPMDKLTSLPAIPLAKIGSSMGPSDCVRFFCNTSPHVSAKLVERTVSWDKVKVLPLHPNDDAPDVLPNILSSLRACRVAWKEKVKSFHLGRDPLLMCKEAAQQAFFQAVQGYVYSPGLEELEISSIWLKYLVHPLPATLKKMVVHQVHDNFPNCGEFWAKQSALQFASLATEVAVIFHDEPRMEPCQGGVRADFAPMPNVTRLEWLHCGGPSGVPPFECFSRLHKLAFNYGGNGLLDEAERNRRQRSFMDGLGVEEWITNPPDESTREALYNWGQSMLRRWGEDMFRRST